MNAFVQTPAPPFPPNPSVGQVFLNWVWSGSSWICRGAGPVLIIKAFTGNTTYWPSPGLTFAIVEAIGGGGGGGSVTLPNVANGGSGGGGGSGGYSRSALAAALLVNGVQVTIGQGGTPGVSGGTTSFGAYCVANGGDGGTPLTLSAGAWGLGGYPASPGTGDLAQPGSAGETGAVTENIIGPLFGAMGGVGPFGGGNVPSGEVGNNQSIAGVPAWPTTGGGGGGACAVGTLTASVGGPGGSGLVIVTEYCFGNTSNVQDCGCAPTSDPCAPCPPGGQGWWTPNW